VVDPLRYYDLETYLFEDVHRRFHSECSLGAFDFFSIIIWKANRAKSLIARRLLREDPKRRSSLDPIVRDLTADLYRAPNAEARLRILMEIWGFALPMASAVLAALWPDEFSVYDVRVCQRLRRFQNLGSRTKFAKIWVGYCEYLEAVRSAAPPNLSLRDKDRYLWGESVAHQLGEDIENRFDSGRTRGA
jgi:hypothetical protein